MQVIKSLAIAAFVIVVLFSALELYLYGLAWVTERLMPPMFIASWYALLADILLVLPLSAVRRLRRYTGRVFQITSFLFIFTSWVVSAVVTLSVWGGVGFYLGLGMAGVGMIVVGLFAALHHNDTVSMVSIVVLIAAGIAAQKMATKCAASNEPLHPASTPGSPHANLAA